MYVWDAIHGLACNKNLETTYTWQTLHYNLTRPSEIVFFVSFTHVERNFDEEAQLYSNGAWLFIIIAKNPHVHCPLRQLWERGRQKKGRHKKLEKKLRGVWRIVHHGVPLTLVPHVHIPGGVFKFVLSASKGIPSILTNLHQNKSLSPQYPHKCEPTSSTHQSITYAHGGGEHTVWAHREL